VKKFSTENLRFINFAPRRSFAKSPNEIHFIAYPLLGCTLFDLADLQDALRPVLRKKVYVRTKLCIPFIVRQRFLYGAELLEEMVNFKYSSIGCM
jgi:hypothetical protein